ncbi:hypothetical protein VZT92_010176 [Zoarces viviparus]|uniref:Uncharacterized protein n=1 Tax=Zoarces viviparus TaxID=48416 RepID=A0AAW1FGS2_ZOAVI
MILGTPHRYKPAQTRQTQPGCPPLALGNSLTSPDSSQPCPARPPPAGSGRWCGVAVETSAGQTIGALCGPLELTGPELPLLCAALYTCR